MRFDKKLLLQCGDNFNQFLRWLLLSTLVGLAVSLISILFCWVLFTAVTIGAGFKGGEIVPSLFTGAAFGALFGSLFGINIPLCAAIGMVSVFCGVTNCPVTALLIGFELFGFTHAPYYLIAISISYMLSGHYSLYHTQRILYPKVEKVRQEQSGK